MPGDGVKLHATTDVNRIEAPVTIKAYLMCAFAAFGGIFFGYDSGYINGVTASKVFYQSIEGSEATALSGPHNSLIVSILSAGTFFGALFAGDLAEWYGRRPTIIAGCFVYTIGVIIQITHTTGLGRIVAGRLIAGIGVGFVSAIIILYMSEVAPRKVRGALVSGYQFCITIGLLLASCVDFATEKRTDTGSYRIPIGIQFAWGIILATGLFLLPESPRYLIKKGRIEDARRVLERLRGQPGNSEYIEDEIAEIMANHEFERQLIPDSGYWGSWYQCFTGGLWTSNSNLRKTILGTSLQMMQQWTGVNFIFYFSSTFLQSTGAISNVFLTSMIFTIINVCSTPLSFWTMERFGRRPLLIYGALGMFICQIIVGAVGDTVGFNKTHTVGTTTVANSIPAVNAQVAFIAIYIFFFASTWGPGAWVVIGEIFPIPIRSRGVALSTASNWLWNTIISVITPFMVATDEGNLRSNVFWVWGSLCGCCFIYAYLLIPETKGLSLEQVDQMMAETTPRTSSGWVPTKTFAQEMGMVGKELVDNGSNHDNEKSEV
ncbi:putative MFS monosaccharide transporter [Rhodocollybia butyracea]|uniref:MFS monosaccharide transporter n=1 Tax=Rhodocollybia butyracea TaxID=206335 RepID=A0A9P5U0U0_9AGAR|nr:putative MFS monosaccharide transporter [Rhodocollybia butyracea]